MFNYKRLFSASIYYINKYFFSVQKYNILLLHLYIPNIVLSEKYHFHKRKHSFTTIISLSKGYYTIITVNIQLNKLLVNLIFLTLAPIKTVIAIIHQLIVAVAKIQPNTKNQS